MNQPNGASPYDETAQLPSSAHPTISEPTPQPPDGGGSITLQPDASSPVAAKNPDSEEVPRQVGEFEIVGKLGAGGMGTVYRARQQSLHREVALKVLPAGTSKSNAERFLREARAAAAVNHPNVVTVFAAGQDKGYLFIAMELVVGGDASDLTSPGHPLDEARILEIAGGCSEGLRAIDDAGLVHRDIKPANIFITEDGRAKLADLGLARGQAAEDSQLTGTGMIVGTPAYMSPEQARAEQLDIRSDIYSLGASLYCLATGRVPFAGSSAWVVVASVLNDTVTPIRELNPDLSKEVCQLIERAMAKDKQDRFQTPRELLDAVKTLSGLSASGVSPPRRPASRGTQAPLYSPATSPPSYPSRPPSSVVGLRPPAPSSSGPAPLLVGGLLALLAGGGAYLALKPPPVGAADVASATLPPSDRPLQAQPVPPPDRADPPPPTERDDPPPPRADLPPPRSYPPPPADAGMNLLARTSSLEAEPSPGASADAPPSRSLSFETIPNPAIEVSELPGGLLARTRRGNVLEWSSVRVLGQERLRLPFSGEPLRIHWSIDTIQVLANATPPPAREPSEGFPGTGGWRVHLGVRASRSDYVRANRLQEALWITLLFEDSSRGLRVSGLLRQVNQHKRPGSLSKDSGGLEIVHSFGPMPCESGRPYVVELELDQRGARMRYPEPDRGLRATEFRTWGEGRARLAGAFAAGVHLFAEVGGWRNGRGGSRIIARVPELPAESLEPPASAPAPRPSPPSEQEPRPRQPRQPEPRGDRPPPPPPPQRPPDRRGPPPGGRLPPR